MYVNQSPTALRPYCLRLSLLHLFGFTNAHGPATKIGLQRSVTNIGIGKQVTRPRAKIK